MVTSRGQGKTEKGAVVGAAIAACAVLGSCATAPAPVVEVALADVEATRGPPGVDPLTPEERLLALLTADNPRIEEVAMSLARLGGDRTRQEAGQRLVALARAAGANAKAETGEGATAPPPEDDVLEERRAAAIEPIFAAMSHVGGPAVVAYCFAIAEDEAAPWSRRTLALRVLHLAIPDEDKPAQERRARLSARIPSHRPGVAFFDVNSALAYIRPAARRCFNLMLKGDPPFHGSVRVTLHVKLNARTSSWAEGTAPPEVRACLTDAASGLVVTPSAQMGTEITIPFTLIAE